MAINNKYGSFESFDKEFYAKMANTKDPTESNVWPWLVYNKQNCDIDIRYSTNHNIFEHLNHQVPILTTF